LGDKFEVWSTRLFPKGQGAGAYRLTGIAARCDWVILSDQADPKAALRVRPGAPASPRTIFLSLRNAEAALEFFVREVRPRLKSPYVLFSGSEDVTLPNQTDRRWPAWPQPIRSLIDSMLADPQLTAWYTENLDADVHPKLHAMPLGLLPDGGSPMAEVQEFEELARRPLSVLCAHRHRDGPQWEPRRHVTALARESAWINWTTILDEPVEEPVFKRLLSRHAFVLCVEGGGLDPSPKAWLALLHGAIPIIRKSPTAAAYEDLPVVIIDGWESGAITLEKLKEWRSHLSADFQQQAGWREEWFDRLSLTSGWNQRVAPLGDTAHAVRLSTAATLPSGGQAPAPARPAAPDSGDQRLPALCLTHDGCALETVFMLNAYARHADLSGLKFYLPCNNNAARDYYQRCLDPRIAWEGVDSPVPIAATLAALLKAAPETAWIFWMTSDRYPYMCSDPATLSTLARQLRQEDRKLEGIQSVRLTRWGDVRDLTGAKRDLAGLPFEEGRAGGQGLWHPQFLRRQSLEKLVESCDPDAGLWDFHDQLVNTFRTGWTAHPDGRARFLLPATNIVKLEEPTLEGRYTANFFVRSLHLGEPLEAEKLASESAGYASPFQMAARNPGWPADPNRLRRALSDPPPPTRYQIISPGGVGSKMLTRWLEPEAPASVWTLMHSHRRLPPPSAFEAQKFIYVFGDPRNIILSLFNRRFGKSSRHGFQPSADRMDREDPEFVRKHAVNMQADPSIIDPAWDLKTYLAQGLDFLRLEEHFDSWFHGDQPYPVMFARYESLPDTASQLCHWLGVSRPALEFAPRASDWRALPADEQNALDAVYGDLARRLEALPDLIIRQQGRTLTA